MDNGDPRRRRRHRQQEEETEREEEEEEEQEEYAAARVRQLQQQHLRSMLLLAPPMTTLAPRTTTTVGGDPPVPEAWPSRTTTLTTTLTTTTQHGGRVFPPPPPPPLPDLRSSWSGSVLQQQQQQQQQEQAQPEEDFWHRRRRFREAEYSHQLRFLAGEETTTTTARSSSTNTASSSGGDPHHGPGGGGGGVAPRPDHNWAVDQDNNNGTLSRQPGLFLGNDLDRSTFARHISALSTRLQHQQQQQDSTAIINNNMSTTTNPSSNSREGNNNIGDPHFAVYEALLRARLYREQQQPSSSLAASSAALGQPPPTEHTATVLFREAMLLAQQQQQLQQQLLLLRDSSASNSSARTSSSSAPLGTSSSTTTTTSSSNSSSRSSAAAAAADLAGLLSRSAALTGPHHHHHPVGLESLSDRGHHHHHRLMLPPGAVGQGLLPSAGLFPDHNNNNNNDPLSHLAAQRDALRRSVLEQRALNDRLELLTRQHQQQQQQQRGPLAYNNNDNPTADLRVSLGLDDGGSYYRGPLTATSPLSGRDRAVTTALTAPNDNEDDHDDEGAIHHQNRNRNNDYGIIIPWEALVGDGGLADAANLRGVVSDLHIALMAQMRPCQLNHEDRIGLYKTRDIGFRGMCCKHCGGVTGFGRYFPGSLTSLVNGNICKSILKHLTEECRQCPSGLRESVLKLELHDEHNPFHYRRGSRRRFFSNIWEKIQDGEGLDRGSSGDGGAADNEVSSSLVDHHNNPNHINNRGGATEADLGMDAPSFRNDPGIPWKLILANSEIVLPGDRHLVPDTMFAATAQTRPCQVTEGDRVGRCKDHKLGSMGLCCKHCGGKPGAYGRFFPSNLHTFAQVEVCKQVVKHITRKCPACPLEIRQAIMDLQRREQGMSSKRYPSRMIFFRRVWSRFHVNDKADTTTEDGAAPEGGTLTYDQIPWAELVHNSKLVQIDDRGLIPDSQFISIAQMDTCQLTEEDRIGYNKGREIGFTGMCCRYCRGKPGFGRFFPNTVRNLEKTSARDTMVSHISIFCQSCPDDVRDAVLSLKRIETSRDGSLTMKGLIYGSGKLFFRRIWGRLQGTNAGSDSTDDEKEEEDAKPEAKPSPKRRRRRSTTASPELSRSCRGDQDELSPGDDSSDDESTDNNSTSEPSRKRKLEPPATSDRNSSSKQQQKSASTQSGSQINQRKGKGKEIAMTRGTGWSSEQCISCC